MLRATFLAGVATLLLGAAAARADVVIGLAIPVSGPIASIGDQVRNGATAAIDAPLFPPRDTAAEATPTAALSQVDATEAEEATTL